MVSFGSAWNYISKDWGQTFKFVLLAIVLNFIPVIGQLAIIGLSIKVLANAINKKSEIPKVFNDFGESILDGLKALLFYLIIMIPYLVVIFVLGGGSIAALSSAAMAGNDTAIMTAVMGLIGSLLPVIIILGLIYMLIIPPLFANYAKERNFSAFFNFSKAFKVVFGNFGDFLLMIVYIFVYSLVLGFIGSLISFTLIGGLLIPPFTILICNKIIGDWFAENMKNK